MRRKTGAIVLLAALALVAAASGGGRGGATTTAAAAKGTSGTVSTPRRGGTLRVVRTESFDGWVLDAAAAYASYQTDAAVIEGLLRPGANGTSVERGLAESWVRDAKAHTWTFKLRKNARFSDGSPVTSKDVIFSLGIWKAGPNFGGSYVNIKGATAADARTVVFKLGSAYDNTFLALMASSVSGVMPANFGGKKKAEYYKHPIGAGAFKVDKWTVGGRIQLSRNTFFYDSKRPSVDRVVIDVVADDNERKILFDSGQADLVEYVSAATAAQYDRSKLDVLPPSQIEHLSLNVKHPPFNDVRVRRAVADAIDYQAIIKGPFSGFGAPATGILAPNLANWAPPTQPYYTTNLKRARTLLAGSSAPHGAAAELIYDSGVASDVLVAQILKDNLGKLGFNVKLTGLETGAFVGRAFAVDADMTLWSYGAISPDISDPLGWFLGTGWLFTGLKTDVLSKQFQAYRTAATAKGRSAVIRKIQDQAVASAHAIALTQFQVVHAVNPQLSGFASAPWGLSYYDTISLGK
jgi:peptide/nickel transport system substrate-binding protein